MISMKRNTIKWRIFKYNLIVIVMLIALVSIIFNLAVRMYFESEISSQLDKITSRTVDTALRQGPALYNGPPKKPPATPPDKNISNNDKDYSYYMMLNHSLKEPLSLLNSDYILLDKEKNMITPLPEMYSKDTADLLNRLVGEVRESSKDFSTEEYLNLSIEGRDYIAVVKPLSQKNDFGLGWIIIYSSLQKVNQLQLGINIILFVILIFSFILTVLLSSNLSKKLSLPFYWLNEHIKAIAKRDFGHQIKSPVFDELQEVVNSINIMSEKLGTYDKAQKTFLQNMSHEFRTPLMSIQSYSEGIKYNVVDSGTAVDIILEETKRMTHLLEELLYLSRLDSIEENYRFEKLDLNKLISCSIDRMKAIAGQNNIRIIPPDLNASIELNADEEKLSRALTNIIGNCIRYARTTVTLEVQKHGEKKLEIRISDDGPGFASDELPNVFKRFYKGEKGNLGLGLAISKNVIERHNGAITAENRDCGGALFIMEFSI